MIVWTVANQKGGVGKTTTVVSLAGILAQRGQRVLLIDTDPHASLTSYFDFDSDRLEGTLYELFQAAKPSSELVNRMTLKTKFENIHLLPASITLATLDRVMGNREGMGLVLKRALLRVQDQYDYVLIDCPPVLGVMMVNALAACDRILVPVQTEFLALKGLERMMKTFEIMQRSKRDKFRYTVIPTMFDKRTRASLMTLQSIKEQYGEAVWNAVIPIDTKFRDASLLHIPPSIYAPGSRGTYAYETLLNFIDALERQRTQEVKP
ncbi:MULTISPECIES: ParA family protein [Aeromonas]|uniref:ParA family protein n=2 Tax=Aeromonas TaxID=642 RepID=A0AAP6SVQ9_9GAMM|nr:MULTISPECIES: ParA family protein [Aeromonas]HCH53351.1 cobalamin biosynthesis protein CobQ [Aeromonas sp.]MBS4698992.1 ParA family protein [Aeromonas media]MCE9944664.1 ParA family protein [Aeromonas rivipollensis]MDM5061014.1 ParA family protein [Aeromonas rivipollensis]MDM5085166.1 ParA family protein [Aeromonas rivipollensis]